MSEDRESMSVTTLKAVLIQDLPLKNHIISSVNTINVQNSWQ